MENSPTLQPCKSCRNPSPNLVTIPANITDRHFVKCPCGMMTRTDCVTPEEAAKIWNREEQAYVAPTKIVLGGTREPVDRAIDDISFELR